MGIGPGALAHVVNQDVWVGQRVLVTGHTGFKGSWLCMWLSLLGAEVHGLALEPPTQPNLYEDARVSQHLATDRRIDVRDYRGVLEAIIAIEPTVVFHLAAQPLVRQSYTDPLETFSTNVMGTAHVLEAVRKTPAVRAVVVVTTDKVYRNIEDGHAYRESEPLGGHDPYSASKAAAEIVAGSFGQSFFTDPSGPAIATARAGNVIGGGDWSDDRLVPDCIRALGRCSDIPLRYPDAVRPWQHVFEPISGYVNLAQHLFSESGHDFATAWNFGPSVKDVTTVQSVAKRLVELWGGTSRIDLSPAVDAPHEANLLSLDSTKAATELDWVPQWDLDTALQATVQWYQARNDGQDMAELSRDQLVRYVESSNG